MFKAKRLIEGGVKVVKMVNRTNLILVITSGNDPNLSSSYLHFWDDRKIRFMGKVNKFDSDPLTICHADNVITVGTQNKICCLKMGVLEVFTTIETGL